MAKRNSTPKKEALRVSVKSIKSIQAEHGIDNFLAMDEADTKKLSVDFFIDFYFLGSRKWENPPTKDEIEDMELAELTDAFGDALGSKK